MWFHMSIIAVTVVFLLANACDAKISSGKVHLSGVKTESTLVKMAISSGGSAKLDLNLTSYGMYVDEKELRLRMYVDEEWPKVRRLPLCSDKVQLAQQGVPIVFDYKGTKMDDRKGKNKIPLKEMYGARIQIEVPNPPNPHRRPKKKDRSRYYYFTIDDCSLERSNQDGKIPDILFDLSVLNGRPSPSNQSNNGPLNFGHLPSDEDGIGFLLMLTIIFSGGLTMLLFYKFARTIGGEVHIAILVVMAACLTNGLSSLCELLHRSAFAINGYGIYSLDALSSHFEALSDSMVSLTLLSIGGGWTLPSDVVGGGMGKEASSNKLLKGVRNPAGAMLDLMSSGEVVETKRVVL